MKIKDILETGIYECDLRGRGRNEPLYGRDCL